MKDLIAANTAGFATDRQYCAHMLTKLRGEGEKLELDAIEADGLAGSLDIEASLTRDIDRAYILSQMAEGNRKMAIKMREKIAAIKREMLKFFR